MTQFVTIPHLTEDACMVFYVTTEHTYVGDLEVWIGRWDSSSSMYLEQKIWDHQGGSNLQLTVNVKGLQNVHNWRLRVVDSAAGDEGSITEFYDLIG